jgi:hypothetical protein
MKSTFSLAVLAATALQASNFLAAAQSLPVVDVLTTRHQAISNVRILSKHRFQLHRETPN